MEVVRTVLEISDEKRCGRAEIKWLGFIERGMRIVCVMKIMWGIVSIGDLEL